MHYRKFLVSLSHRRCDVVVVAEVRFKEGFVQLPEIEGVATGLVSLHEVLATVLFFGLDRLLDGHRTR